VFNRRGETAQGGRYRKVKRASGLREVARTHVHSIRWLHRKRKHQFVQWSAVAIPKSADEYAAVRSSVCHRPVGPRCRNDNPMVLPGQYKAFVLESAGRGGSDECVLFLRTWRISTWRRVAYHKIVFVPTEVRHLFDIDFFDGHLIDIQCRVGL
jgi:hypothetical protein